MNETFEELIEKGKEFKSQCKLAEAISFYKKALGVATSKDQKGIAWEYIIHCHTDRLISASEEFYADTGNPSVFTQWTWGPTRVPDNYVRPPRDEALR